MINLRNKTEALLNKNKHEIENRFLQYYKDILKNNNLIYKYRSKFFMKGWLRAYINVTQAKSKSPEFSIRYGGQEIAQMKFNKRKEKYYLCIDDNTSKGIYGLELPRPDKYEWKESKEAKSFRKRFEKVPPENAKGIDEHRYESFILDEMQNQTGNKFGGTFKYIRPVLIAGKIPFQMPLPIAACGGKAKYIKSPNAGHIDILARFGRSKPSLTVIELKRPGGKYENAIAQSFIYTVTISYLLEQASVEVRNALWKLCGYGGKIYSNIKFNSVVGIPEESWNMYEKELQQLEPDIDSSNISLKHLVYKLTKKNTIKIIKTDLRQRKEIKVASVN